MLNKKGQGISMTYIIVAALALVVLIVIILFFTGALEKMFKQQQDVVGEVTEQQKSIWRSQCRLYCSLGQEESWNSHKFGDNELECKNTELMGKSWEDCEGEEEEQSKPATQENI